VQEALSNVVRHSGSTRAAVRLRFDAAALVIEVEDEGVGYTGIASKGLGLVSMRERTDLVHGTIEFVTGKAGGALVRVAVPYAQKEAHAG